MSPRTRRLAFCIPRYFEGIAGGAETLLGELAKRLLLRGNEIEILTTCAVDNRTWENKLSPGNGIENGMCVRRFEVDKRNLDLWIPRQIQISEGMNIGVEEELVWLENSVNSRALYDFIARNAAKYDAMLFGPYLFGTTFWGSLIEPSKSILVPCLHDEHYAYTRCLSSMFRQVRGALFNSEPEADLARSLYGDIKGAEVGMGFDSIPTEEVASLTPYFDWSEPYILYLGRKETGKNVQVLIDYFVGAKSAKRIDDKIKLVILGGGSFDDLHRPEALSRGDIIDAPHVSERDKQRILRYATVLCQPSTNESFSIVLMEAWRLGVPVLVNARCTVTRDHVVKSGGGLYFGGEEEFGGVFSAILSNQTLAVKLATAGKRYVEAYYSWNSVLNRFDNAMTNLGV